MNRLSIRKPVYWLAKINKFVFKNRFPDAPWLAESAVYLLDSWLRPTDVGVEWGAGRSTIWFACRVQKLMSVESKQKYHDDVKAILGENGHLGKVDLHWIPIEANVSETAMSHPYGDIVSALQNESLDFALVDGIRLRALCMEKVIPKIKPGGLLILDNAERFVPNRAMGKHTVSILPRDKCPDKRWDGLLKTLSDWRAIITTNGIWDTRFWIKPTIGAPCKEV